MSEYISREELIDRLNKTELSAEQIRMLVYPREAVVGAIYDCSPADVRPNIHAYWEDLEPDKDILFKSNMPYRCTACGQRAGKHKVSTYKYCPSCGAIMDGEPKGEKGD